MLIGKINSFTYHFNRINDLTTYTQVSLKCIQRWRISDNIVTMTCRFITVNITIIPFHNNWRHVHHIDIKYSFLVVFLLFIICSIINKMHLTQLLWEPSILEYLQLYTLPYLAWLNASLIFDSQERYNTVFQAWQLHEIIIIENFRTYFLGRVIMIIYLLVSGEEGGQDGWGM